MPVLLREDAGILRVGRVTYRRVQVCYGKLQAFCGRARISIIRTLQVIFKPYSPPSERLRVRIATIRPPKKAVYILFSFQSFSRKRSATIDVALGAAISMGLIRTMFQPVSVSRR